MADNSEVVEELYTELNMRLDLLNPGKSKPISEEAVRMILQSLEDLGYLVIKKNVEVDSSRAQDLVIAITNMMPDVKWNVLAAGAPATPWDDLTAAVPAILQDLASRGWILIPPA